jgi:hypothetical protein
MSEAKVRAQPGRPGAWRTCHRSDGSKAGAEPASGGGASSGGGGDFAGGKSPQLVRLATSCCMGTGTIGLPSRGSHPPPAILFVEMDVAVRGPHHFGLESLARNRRE